MDYGAWIQRRSSGKNSDRGKDRARLGPGGDIFIRPIDVSRVRVRCLERRLKGGME